MASTYSSPFATTSIEACARNGIMVRSKEGSGADAGSMSSDVIMTLWMAHASAMTVASSAFSPAVETVITRSAAPI
jgi:hypothetical protein